MQFYYHVNLDERGEFYADVRNDRGKTVYEIYGFSIFEDGFMAHEDDIDGLCDYLQSIGVIGENDTLEFGE